jgi:uncharacterized membrane protein
METLRNLEYGLSPAALLILCIYHIYLYDKVQRQPLHTSIGLAQRTRALWVQMIMKAGKDILAVQTLRNWTMAATFLASAAILIALGILNIAVTSEKQGALSLQLMSDLGSGHPALWLGKLILLGTDFLFVFYNFTLAVRYYNHTSFMINLPTDSSTEISVEDVVKMLDRGGTHYTLGMRGYYLAIPLTFWLFGPLWLLAGTLLLVITLYRLDRGV